MGDQNSQTSEPSSMQPSQSKNLSISRKLTFDDLSQINATCLIAQDKPFEVQSHDDDDNSQLQPLQQQQKQTQTQTQTQKQKQQLPPQSRSLPHEEDTQQAKCLSSRVKSDSLTISQEFDDLLNHAEETVPVTLQDVPNQYTEADSNMSSYFGAVFDTDWSNGMYKVYNDLISRENVVMDLETTELPLGDSNSEHLHAKRHREGVSETLQQNTSQQKQSYWFETKDFYKHELKRTESLNNPAGISIEKSIESPSPQRNKDSIANIVVQDSNQHIENHPTTSSYLGTVLEKDWRNAMIKVCADLIKVKLESLQSQYDSCVIIKSKYFSTISPDSMDDDDVDDIEEMINEMRNSKLISPSAAEIFTMPQGFWPRDFVDFVIMLTLRTVDAFSVQNARSWIFNLMDRNGGGTVFRDEFIRYASLMPPAADMITVDIIFGLLLDSQEKVEQDAKSASEKADGVNKPTPKKNEHKRKNSKAAKLGHSGLKYETWKIYFDRLKLIYTRESEDWNNVKQKLGIDAKEPLVKSQGALDHSDVLPTPGTLYLSERYLIFFASVGSRHYVIRIEYISSVSTSSLPVLMRDCLQIHLEPETKTALLGYQRKTESSVDNIFKDSPAREAADSNSADVLSADRISASLIANDEENSDDSESTDAEENVEESSYGSLSTAAEELTRSFQISGNPLIFSFMEFRETKRRDQWLNYIQELCAAHKLHVSLGFKGNRGRVKPGNRFTSKYNHSDPKSSSIKLSKFKSPFSDDPQAPLLVVSAAANIYRLRAIKRTTGQRGTWLLMFSKSSGSNPVLEGFEDSSADARERNLKSVRQYVDTVKSQDPVVKDSGSWVSRAVDSIRENIEINQKIYKSQEEEKFDVQRLGEVISRFWGLIQPLVSGFELYWDIVQWKNPPSTILFTIISLYIINKDWVKYLPSFAFLAYAASILIARVKLSGVASIWNDKDIQNVCRVQLAAKKQANQGYMTLVSNVHTALQATQNTVARWNEYLGKFETLSLWGISWMTWVFVVFLFVTALIFMFIPFRFIFLVFILNSVTSHFRYPEGDFDRFWRAIPSDIYKFAHEKLYAKKKMS